MLRAVSTNPTISNLALNTSSPMSGAILNGLGDSITARAEYQSTAPDLTHVPAWAINTAYTSNQIVSANGWLYHCTAGGTSAASGTGPSGVTGPITDNTVTWQPYNPQSSKNSTSFLFWAEKFANGTLNWDQSRAYNGLYLSVYKVIVISGGSNYSANPTITFSVAGASAAATVVNGVITAVTVVNPGYNLTGALTVSVTDGTGTGAVLSVVYNNSGTFGVSGCRTRDMVARLPDCVNAKVDIFTVLGGTNDVNLDATNFANALTTASTAITNLQTCYETLLASGKKVIAIPILPRTGMSAAQISAIFKINDWIRAYVRKAISDNPNQRAIALADATGYLTDGAASFGPVGGSGGVAGAVTVDGLHPSPRGAQYIGYMVQLAAQSLLGPSVPYTSRVYSYGDGYDLTYAPGGNFLEGLPWTASNQYNTGSLVANDTAPVKVYRCTVAGVSAASGGPTGTGGTITDGTVTWAYVRGASESVLASGTAGTNTAATGIVFSGSLCTGLTLARQTGTSSGTITEAIESPWSNGQAGQRQSIAFSLGTGSTTTEVWRVLVTNSAIASLGIQSSDLNNGFFTFECELEISGIANVVGIYTQIFGQSSGFQVLDGAGSFSVGGTAPGYQIINSSGDPLAYPNGGKLFFRTQPQQLPSTLTTVNSAIYFAFDTSGTAGTATLIAKINYIGLRKVDV